MIIWRISDDKYKIQTEICNFSESNITYLCWSQEGEFLYASNSNGSVYIVEFNEFQIVGKSGASSSQEKNEKIRFSSTTIENQNQKKRITPQLINNLPNLHNLQTKSSYSRSSSGNLNTNSNLINQNEVLGQLSNNPKPSIQDCLRCQKMKYDTLETKIVVTKLESFEGQNVSFIWENKVYDNYSTLTFSVDMKLLYKNKFENKLLRLFTANNSFYVIYDVNNLLCVFTIFNTMV